jgi:hypothetical protein
LLRSLDPALQPHRPSVSLTDPEPRQPCPSIDRMCLEKTHQPSISPAIQFCDWRRTREPVGRLRTRLSSSSFPPTLLRVVPLGRPRTRRPGIIVGAMPLEDDLPRFRLSLSSTSDLLDRTPAPQSPSLAAQVHTCCALVALVSPSSEQEAVCQQFFGNTPSQPTLEGVLAKRLLQVRDCCLCRGLPLEDLTNAQPKISRTGSNDRPPF